MRSVKDAIAYGLRKAQYKDVREHQRKVIEGYCSGKDVFLSAPTGSGKSLTFEVAPYVFDYLEHGERLEVCSVCLDVVPLVALMKDQVASLEDFLKVVRMVFWSGVVGPGKSFRSLVRASRSAL